MSATMYGVATSVYGRGMEVGNKFETLEAAEGFAKHYISGSVVVCAFSDGRWRSVAPVTAFLHCPTDSVVDLANGAGDGGWCPRCGHAYTLHLVDRTRSSGELPGQW